MCVFSHYTLHSLPRAFHLSNRIPPPNPTPRFPPSFHLHRNALAHHLQKCLTSLLYPFSATHRSIVAASCTPHYFPMPSINLHFIYHVLLYLPSRIYPCFILLLSSHFRTESCSLTRMLRCRADPLGFPWPCPRPRLHSTALQLRFHLRSRWLTFDVHHTDTLKESKPNRIETRWICRYTLLQDGMLNSHFRLYNFFPTAYHTSDRDRQPADRIATTQPYLEVCSTIFVRKQAHLKHTPRR